MTNELEMRRRRNRERSTAKYYRETLGIKKIYKFKVEIGKAKGNEETEGDEKRMKGQSELQ
jgi:hypothetical protein